jgi:hypothetical protein
VTVTGALDRHRLHRTIRRFGGARGGGQKAGRRRSGRPEVALSFVVWPSVKLRACSERHAAPRRVRYTEQQRGRALALVAEGWSQQRVAVALGVPRTTVQLWAARLAG